MLQRTFTKEDANYKDLFFPSFYLFCVFPSSPDHVDDGIFTNQKGLFIALTEAGFAAGNKSYRAPCPTGTFVPHLEHFDYNTALDAECIQCSPGKSCLYNVSIFQCSLYCWDFLMVVEVYLFCETWLNGSKISWLVDKIFPSKAKLFLITQIHWWVPGYTSHHVTFMLTSCQYIAFCCRLQCTRDCQQHKTRLGP